MTAQHTPGPWVHIGQGDVVTLSKAGEVTGDIAAAYCTHGPEGDANAHLIAAAPDLLAFIKQRVTEYRPTQMAGTEWIYPDWHAEAQALISKATGTL